MDSTLGRWLLIGLILLIAVSLSLLVPALLRLSDEEQSTPPTSLSAVPSHTPAGGAAHSPGRQTSPEPHASLAASVTPAAASTATPLPEPTPLPPVSGYATHIVEEGETLEEIAARYGSIAPAIASLNRFPADTPLSAEQPLVIPLFVGLEPDEPFDPQGLEIDRGRPGPRVALTLDAGSGPEPAEQILDTLLECDVQITFFLTGRWAEQYPELVRRMAAEGHELGNHTYSHPRLTEIEAEAVREELDRTERIIRDIAGQTTRPLMRPPYGDRNRSVLDLLIEEGYLSIYWTLDSLDSVGDPKTPEFLFQRVTHPTDSRGNPISLEGAIILMHIGNQSTADALPAILQWFQDEGWEVVRVSELLYLP